MRRTLLLLSTMVLALLLACGVALAANIPCQGGPCVGTEQNDRITGSQLDDTIEALGGRDHVTGRMGDDYVDGGGGRDEITGGVGGDLLEGGMGPDEIGGGPGTPDGEFASSFRLRHKGWKPGLMLAPKEISSCSAAMATTISRRQRQRLSGG